MFVQDFCEFFNDLNAYWVAPFVNITFVITAVLAQLYLSSPWGAAMSKPLFLQPSDLKAKTSTLSAVEEQQLLPEYTSSSKDVPERAVDSSTGVCGAHAEVTQLTPLHNGAPRTAQVELTRLSPSSRASGGMPRRRSQPHLPLYVMNDLEADQTHNV